MMTFCRIGDLRFCADTVANDVRATMSALGDNSRTRRAISADVTIVLGDQPVTVSCEGLAEYTHDDWRKAAVDALQSDLARHKRDAEVLGVHLAGA